MNIGINLAITGTIVLNPTVTLAPLTLSADEVAEDATVGTVVGAVVGKTSGSTLSLQDDAGGLFALDGLDIEVAGALDFETAASHNITVRETLAGATNTPRDTVLEITVTDVAEGPSLGPNLVTNGTFDADTDWTKTNATISAGQAQLRGIGPDDNTSVRQIIGGLGAGEDGATVRISYTVSNIAGEGFRVQLGSTFGALRTVDGTYSDDIVYVDANGNLLWLAGVYPSDADVDDVEARIVL